MSGIFAIYTAQDLNDLIEPTRASSRLKNYHNTLSVGAREGPLCREAVVTVLAANRYLAEDALARIEIAYEPLETVIDPEMAVEEDAPLPHEEAETNVLAARLLRVAMLERKWRRLRFVSADVSGSAARRRSPSRTCPRAGQRPDP